MLIAGLRAASLGVVTGVAILATCFPAMAVSLNDNFAGNSPAGVYTEADPATNNAGDIVGTANEYDISKVDVTRPTANSLQVVVHTNFNPSTATNSANAAAQALNLGGPAVGFGSLFFGLSNLSLPSAGAVPSLFQYVLPMPANPGSNGGSTGLYSVNAGNIQLSYSPSATVTFDPNTGFGFSNINLQNTTFTPFALNTPGASLNEFRPGQSVGYTGALDPNNIGSSWAFDPNLKTLTFNIAGPLPSLLSGPFLLAWAMTCGNDVFLANVDVPSFAPPPSETPLPASIFLMGSVFLVAGGARKWRKRRALAAA